MNFVQKMSTFAGSTDKCEKPMEAGPCRGNFSRWHFDKESGECKPFGWGGCKGNENNFLSERECQMRCKDQPGRMRGKSTDLNDFAAKKFQIHFVRVDNHWLTFAW
jgi:Kunitz/Bovine pancreatic trypsin inhibitor domain